MQKNHPTTNVFLMTVVFALFGCSSDNGSGAERADATADAGADDAVEEGSTDDGTCTGTPQATCPQSCIQVGDDLCALGGSEETCTNGAECGWWNGACVSTVPSCSSYTTAETCVSMSGIQCTWVTQSDSSDCVAPEVATCNELSSTTCGTVTGCTWEPPPTTTTTTSTPGSCSGSPTYSSCSRCPTEDCGSCAGCIAINCDSYSLPGCTAPYCTESASLCRSMGCTWSVDTCSSPESSSGSLCYGEPTSCSLLSSSSTCESTGCTWTE